MAQFEYEFSQKDRELVFSQDIGQFEGRDYIRLTIYPQEAPNSIVSLGGGNRAIFYSSLNASPFLVNTSQFNQALDNFTYRSIGGGDGVNDFQIYKNSDGSIYIKPNEIFNTFELPEGNYRIQIDFLNQLSPPLTQIAEDDPVEDDPGGDIEEPVIPYNFVIKEISTTRKEVRIKLLDKNITSNDEIINHLTNEFNTDKNSEIRDKYQFRHFLNIGTGDHIPIMNYTFDKVTNGKENQSIILKLYDPIPSGIQTPRSVSLEREVLITQVENIKYFSDVPDVYFGQGLEPDFDGDYGVNIDGEDLGFQSYNEISSSLSNVVLDSLISQSQYNYPNINTDFTKFENHTFFGSAKKKLQNFKTKVDTIQGHYTEISKSLSVSCSIDGDSAETIQRRKNLFKKVNDEIKTFTPYERFLYFDGQSETTASAPGLGKNYADIVPVAENFGSRIGEIKDYLGTLNNSDGFPVVYHHSSKLNGKNTNLNFLIYLMIRKR